MSEFEPLPCQHFWVRDDSGPRPFLCCTLCGLEDSVKRFGFEAAAPPDEACIVRDEAIADLEAQVRELTQDLNQAHRMLSSERDRVAFLTDELGATRRAVDCLIVRNEQLEAQRPAPSPAPVLAPPQPAEPKPAYRWGLLLT